MAKLLICVAISLILCTDVNGKKVKNTIQLPKYLRVCHRSDPDLNDCVRQAIEAIRPRLAKGVPELGLAPCEPLHVPHLKLTQHEGAVSLSSEYTDIVIHGPSQFHLKSVRMDPVKQRIRMRLWFPRLQMDAKYNLKGRILMMPLVGSGPCQGNYTDIDAAASLQARKVMRHGEEYLQIEDLLVDFNIGGASVHLEDLFGGDPELGEAMNQFLNDNWRSVAGELRPALEDAMAGILKSVVAKLFAAVPLNQLLPE